MATTGKRCVAFNGYENNCPDDGRHEFCGMCSYHWQELSDKKRLVLIERYEADPPPPPPIIQQVQPVIVKETVRTIYPVRSRLQRAALIVWRVTVAVGLGYLGLCWWRGK